MLWFHLMFIGGCSTSIDLIWKVITLQTLWFISFGVFTPVPHGCQDWSILMPFWLKIDQSISFISARAWVLSAPRHAAWFWIWTARRRRLRITEDLELRRSGWAECGSQSLRGSDAQVLGALARNWRCGGSVDPGGGHPWRSNGVTVPDMVGRRDHVERGFVDQCSYWTWSSDAAQLGIPSRALRQLHAGRDQGSPSGLHRVGHWEQLCQLGWGRSSRLGSPGFSALLVADAAGHISLMCWHQGLHAMETKFCSIGSWEATGLTRIWLCRPSLWTSSSSGRWTEASRGCRSQWRSSWDGGYRSSALSAAVAHMRSHLGERSLLVIQLDRGLNSECAPGLQLTRLGTMQTAWSSDTVMPTTGWIWSALALQCQGHGSQSLTFLGLRWSAPSPPFVRTRLEWRGQNKQNSSPNLQLFTKVGGDLQWLRRKTRWVAWWSLWKGLRKGTSTCRLVQSSWSGRRKWSTPRRSPRWITWRPSLRRSAHLFWLRRLGSPVAMQFRMHHKILKKQMSQWWRFDARQGSSSTSARSAHDRSVCQVRGLLVMSKMLIAIGLVEIEVLLVPLLAWLLAFLLRRCLAGLATSPLPWSKRSRWSRREARLTQLRLRRKAPRALPQLRARRAMGRQWWSEQRSRCPRSTSLRSSLASERMDGSITVFQPCLLGNDLPIGGAVFQFTFCGAVR